MTEFRCWYFGPFPPPHWWRVRGVSSYLAKLCTDPKCTHSGVIEPYNGQRIRHDPQGHHLETCRCSRCSGVD